MGILSSLPRSLPWRIAMLMSLAMLPLGMISVYQTKAVVTEAKTLAQDTLVSRTKVAAQFEREHLQHSLGLLQGLAAVLTEVDTAVCNKMLTNLVTEQDSVTYAVYFSESEENGCGFAPDNYRNLENAFDDQSVSDSPEWRIQNGLDEQSGAPVLIARYPIFDEARTAGYVILAHSLEESDYLTPRSVVQNDDLTFTMISADEDLFSLATSATDVKRSLPRGIPTDRLLSLSEGPFEAVSNAGKKRVFAIVPVISGELVMIGSKPSQKLSDNVVTGFALLFPILMWITSIAIAVFGLQRLVVRPIENLRSAVRRFALGDRERVRLDLRDLPEEIEGAQRAFNRMALIITEAELKQKKDLQDKEVLVREVHHRVNNNLQLISSIINMQMRESSSKDAMSILAGLQRRVRGMAMLHRTLYTTPDMTTIDAAELVGAVVDDTRGHLHKHDVNVETTLTSIALYPDQAVPLSMFVAEVLPNALIGVTGSVKIELTVAENSTVKLSIRKSVEEAADIKPDEQMSHGIGRNLIEAFASQLDGELSFEANDLGICFELVFPTRNVPQTR